MIMRSAILGIVVAAMIVGYRYYREWSQDIDLPASADTAGYISAIHLLDEGSQAVVFKPDGSMVASPGYAAGKSDKDAVWRPDGNRLFFISDREDNAQNIFRWNFGANSVARRTYNSRTKGLPAFLPGPEGVNVKTALITSGGFVLELDPSTGATHQVLPPVAKERSATNEESGAGGQFDAVYEKLGTSFREAKWTPDRQYVVAVMRREDGEALVIQEMSDDKLPVPIAVGDKIEFDVDGKTGMIAFMVLNYKVLDLRSVPPQFLKNGKLMLPFRHLLGVVDPKELATIKEGDATQIIKPIAQSNTNNAFQRLSISPDGAQVMVVQGEYNSSTLSFEPKGLVVMPFQPSGSNAAAMVLREKVYEPSWHPNSETIAFIRYNANGKRSICTIRRDGTQMTEISKDAGDFAWPKFSPQSK